MEQQKRDAVLEVERQRARLEESVAKLRKSLRHWQTWEAEYEGLKGEIEGLKGEPTHEEIIVVGEDFGGELVNEREIKDIVGIGKGISRNRAQIVGILSNRIRYVQQNVVTLEKQLNGEENRLNATLALGRPDKETEDGLPLTEIREELDEDGNIISSTLLNPGRDAPQMVETLKKAGISDLDPGISATKSIEEDIHDVSNEQTSAAEQSTSSQPQARPHKSVAFADDVKESVNNHHQKANGPEVNPSKHGAPAFGDASFTSGNRIIELDDEDRKVGSKPIVLPDESPKDAQLRRDMLQYQLDETGAFVAELDIVDTDESHSDEELEDLEDLVDSDEDVDEEEEDQYGRSTRTAIDEDYRRTMMELEKRLNVGRPESLGSQLQSDVLKDVGNHSERLIVRDDEPSMHAEDAEIQENPNGKKVRFADDLDISTAPSSTRPPKPSAPPVGMPTVQPFSDAIVERAATTTISPSAETQPKSSLRPSRFKSSQSPTANNTPEVSRTSPNAAQPALAETRPPLSSTIVERPAPASAPNAPVTNGHNDDDLDPALMQGELLAQYHSARNRMIQQQPGGFMPSAEEEANPLLEERDGRVRKVSRFRAARLGGGDKVG